MEMTAFDGLPEEARVALNYAAFKHFAHECREVMVRRRIDGRELMRVIVKTDAYMMREGQQSGGRSGES